MNKRHQSVLRSLSFKSLLIAILVSCQIVLLLVFSVIAVYQIETRANTAFADNLSAGAGVFSRRAAFALITTAQDQRREILSFATDNPNVDAAFLLGPEGDLLESVGAPLEIQPAEMRALSASALASGGQLFRNDLVFIIAVYSDAPADPFSTSGTDGEHARSLLGYFGFLANDNMISGYVRRMSVVVAFMLVISVVVIYFVSRWMAARLLIPLSRLVDETRTITDMDYRGTVAENGPREFAHLAGAINDLLRRVVRDADELQELVEIRTQEEQKLRAVAQDLLTWRSEMMSTQAHEILSPVGLISIAAEELQREAAFVTDPITREGIEDRVEGVAKQVKQLRSLVHKMALSILIEQDRLDATITLIEPADVLRKMKTGYSDRAAASGNAIEFYGAEQEAFYSDGWIVEHILRNLLSNACKYTENGLIKVSIATTLDHCIIVVEDNGIGIPEDKQQTVFHAMRQADMSPRRPADGIGLGLSIVQRLLEKIDGTISLESEPGVGTKFQVNVPNQRPEAS